MTLLRILCLPLLMAFALLACRGGAVKSSTPATQPSNGAVTLRWQTGSEVEVSGFNVMRSDAMDGPYAAVNPQLIPGSGTSAGPHAYEYVDRNLQAGRIYYYYLNQVLQSGEEQKLSETRAFTARPLEP